MGKGWGGGGVPTKLKHLYYPEDCSKVWVWWVFDQFLSFFFIGNVTREDLFDLFHVSTEALTLCCIWDRLFVVC